MVGAWSHLSMKEGSLFYFVLFCSYEIHRTRMVLLVSLESSGRVGMSKGCMSLVLRCLDLGCKSF